MSSSVPTEDRRKKPYERPELVIYGDIRELTQSVARNNTPDGGHGAHSRTS
jgi:hypothetical protein